MAITDQIINIESGGNPNARNSNSSASGAGQFIDSTWLAMLAKHRPDVLDGRSRDELLALKSDPNISRDMTAAYAADNAGILAKAGLSVTPGTQYLAHFAGPEGAVGILNADPFTPIEAVLSPNAITANPFLKGKTAGDIASWADRKMTGKGTSPTAPMSFAGAMQMASAEDPEMESNAKAESLLTESEANPQQVSQSLPDIFGMMMGPQVTQKSAPMLLLHQPKIDLARIYAARSRIHV